MTTKNEEPRTESPGDSQKIQKAILKDIEAFQNGSLSLDFPGEHLGRQHKRQMLPLSEQIELAGISYYLAGSRYDPEKTVYIVTEKEPETVHEAPTGYTIVAKSSISSQDWEEPVDGSYQKAGADNLNKYENLVEVLSMQADLQRSDKRSRWFIGSLATSYVVVAIGTSTWYYHDQPQYRNTAEIELFDGAMRGVILGVEPIKESESFVSPEERAIPTNTPEAELIEIEDNTYLAPEMNGIRTIKPNEPGCVNYVFNNGILRLFTEDVDNIRFKASETDEQTKVLACFNFDPNEKEPTLVFQNNNQ